jgi:signal transduction histidine kinase
MAELGTIGSSIAHDINNPLGGMLSFLQLIKMDLPKDNPIYGDIIQMESAGMRCKSIVENLLSFSRRQETDLIEEIDLRKVIDQALKIITLQTRALGIEIIDNYTAEFSTTFIGNFNLLSQALSYIFQNAFDAVSDKLKSTPGYKGQITVQLQATAKHKILTVTDNGIGITPEHQNKILNPLFSTKSNNKNKGLGLTLAYQIINDSRGQLEIYSQPNVGTTVKISFQNV